ncbi:MAG: hypothetical protein ACI38B_04670 [Bifidobacterium sp.]|uniref:hypothetical protein n=1 Tax=Bifidobacterium sp. TaxID=41200 RepID=UPI003F0E541B
MAAGLVTIDGDGLIGLLIFQGFAVTLRLLAGCDPSWGEPILILACVLRFDAGQSSRPPMSHPLLCHSFAALPFKQSGSNGETAQRAITPYKHD